MPRRLIALLLACALLAACDSPLPTLTPTRGMSAPTLAPSAVILPLLPTGEPADRAGAGQNDPTAAALPSGAELPPLLVGTPSASAQAVEITTADGVLRGTLYPDSLGRRVPGVLLLALDEAGWGDFPRRLSGASFTVLSVSIPPATSTAAFDALMRALIQVGTVDPVRMAVVAADEAAAFGLIGCAGEPLCDALALLNPLGTATSALLRYNPRPILIAAFQPGMGFDTASALRAASTGDALFITADAPPGIAVSGQMLAQPTVGDEILAWLAGRWG